MPILRFPARALKTPGIRIASSRAVHETNTGPSHSISDARVLSSFFPMPSQMKVRVLRVPPSRVLEGIDLRPYKLQEGNVYDLEPQVATVLILWKYAEPVNRPRRRKKGRK